MTITQHGTGAASFSLLALWNAADKPERVFIASLGRSTCSIDGFRFTAETGGACAAGAMALVEREGRLYGTPCGTVSPAAVFSINPSLDLLIASLMPVSLATFGVDWWTVQPYAQAQTWVRRSSWADATQMLRYTFESGTTPAVALIQGAAIPRRAVRNSDFGAVDFEAHDWLVPTAGAELDLTDARLSVSGGSWILGHARLGTTGGPGDGTPDTPGTTTTPGGISCPYSSWDHYDAFQ